MNSEIEQRPSAGKLIVILGLSLVSTAIYVMIYFAVPQFESLFAGFGADLPRVASLLIRYSGIVAIVGVLSSALPAAMLIRSTYNNSDTTDRLVAITVCCFIVACAVLGLAVYALYAPIFAIGEPV